MATDEQTLASLSGVDSSTFAIDPSLDTELLLSQLKQDGDASQNDNNDHGIDDATVTAIKQSLSEAQAHADRQAQQELEDSTAHAGSSKVDIGPLGSESNPINNPPVHLAPFSRPERNDSTPYPEHYAFASKEEFQEWFDGEISWCHFVQRRTTTPQQRAEERMKARVKAFEKTLSEMPPEQAANVPPLKTRKRNNTTPVHMKITYTCHHAGKYDSTHSDKLPQGKLRMKTKQSVKCKCTARIMFTVLHSGECQTIYYWKHDGHDPFSDTEHQSGRLPAIVDEWIVKQIEAGRDTDDIRKVLSIPEDEKQAYVQRVTEDPSLIDPNMPPALAFQMQIKYPDIYNRYRKLRGPIRATKAPKPRSRKRQKLSPSAQHSQEPMPALPHPDSTSISQQFGLEPDGNIPTGYDLSELSKEQHSDLAQALMRLPPAPGAEGVESGEGGDDDTRALDQQVLNMARIAAERVEGNQGEIEEEHEPVEGINGDGQDQRDEIGSVDWNAFSV